MPAAKTGDKTLMLLVMKLYFFYTPSQYRTECRQKGIIDFKLEALYCQDAYSDKVRKNIKSFSYFDVLKTFVVTKMDGQYNFRLETGKDMCTGHFAKSEKELLEAYKGSIRISERNYLRLRKVAIGLLFRHTKEFNHPLDGESKYLWCNETYGSFYDIHLSALNYKYNYKNEDAKTLEFFEERKLPLYDCAVPEEIRIHISRLDRRTQERRFKCSTFEITGTTANARYYDIPDAMRSLNRGGVEYQELEKFQFDRIRKICKALMFEYSDLEYAHLKQPQTHSIRILDI